MAYLYKNIAARKVLLKYGMLEIDQQKVELYDDHPAIPHSCPSEILCFEMSYRVYTTIPYWNQGSLLSLKLWQEKFETSEMN